MEQFDKEASRTRDYCAGKNAALRAARPDPSLRKERVQDDKFEGDRIRQFPPRRGE
jgi:hypothetical protein